MLAHIFLLGDPGYHLVPQGATFLAGQAEGAASTANYYDLYNCTLALYAADGPSGPEWTRWNDHVRDRVIALQRPPDSGCERGSWPRQTGHDGNGGRVYTTALGVLTLEVYYRYTPVKK